MACTNAAFCSGGMQKLSTRHGFSSFFFQPLPHGLVADAVDDLKLDQFVGEQVKRPSSTPRRRCTACKLDELRFRLAIQLQRSGVLLLLALQSGRQPVENE